MNCADCHRAISAAESKRAQPLKEDGVTVGFLHNKCATNRRTKAAKYKRRESTLGSVYDEAAARKNRTDLSLEEESARASLQARREAPQEDEQEAWNDWRGPEGFTT